MSITAFFKKNPIGRYNTHTAVIPPMDELGRGAEATIYRTEYRGRDSVVKKRIVKKYRHAELDRHLRSSRTKAEVRVMRNAREAGVRTPVIYDIDTEEGSITMEFLEGESVKDILKKHPEKSKEICGMIGSTVAKLHAARIAHGDLTTSNMILVDGKICLIDFSLGCTKADKEAMGVDLRLLERAMTSAHSDIADAFAVTAEAYAREMPNAKEILSKMDEIKSRARYT